MCEKFSEFWGVKFKKICEFSREFWGAKFGKFCKFFGENFGRFCDFKILNLREFFGANFLRVVRHCERAARRSVAIHYLTKSRFKYKISTQKRTACVMDCFKPFGSRNDEINFKFANLAKILNSHKNHKNLPPNLKQNFKSKYQNLSPQFLYLNSFKRQLNA